MEFSAVLLAGGKSSRMGTDKVGLEIGGLPLWRRQLETLRETGAGEVFVSGRRDGVLADAGLEVIEDDERDGGPLTGLIVSLRRMRFPFLLVLAVDMPQMTSRYLRKLLSQAEPGVGVVPQRGELFEPLAAVYSYESLAVADQCRREGKFALQVFASRLVAGGLARSLAITKDETELFANVNTRGDCDALAREKSL